MLNQSTELVVEKALADVRTGDLANFRCVSWSIIIPFHNERDFLISCLESLALQTVPVWLILVDNGSTDDSAAIAFEACDRLGLEAIHVSEKRPGKVAALQRGLSEVMTRFVATCDADTIYPRDYLQTAELLLDDRSVVAAIAATTPPGSTSWKSRLAGLRLELTARVLKQQCLNGGAGQVFRTSALRDCGGFNPAIWNWVLEDHEIMARIEQFGKIAYHRSFHCHPAERPRTISCIGWGLTEQLRYHLTDREGRLNFFHDFLASRLRERALPSEKLRRVIAAPVTAQ